MSKDSYVTKRLALYVILPGDPDHSMLKRELRETRNVDLFSADGLKEYAVSRFGKSIYSSYSAAVDHHTLISKAELYPDAVFRKQCGE